MARNPQSLFAQWAKNHLSDAQWHIVSPTGTAQYADLGGIYPPDTEDGLPHLYPTVASVFSQSGAVSTDRGDRIFLTPDYTTALSASDLLNAETTGAKITPLTFHDDFGACIAYRATAALPQSVGSAIFTVTGRVKLIHIIGTVTTAIQNQANNTKLTATPSAAGLSAVDICATLDIANDAVGTVYNITGTFANALVGASQGAAVYQAAPVTLEAGTLDLNCAASNTGSVKWQVWYLPLDPGARMIPA